MSFKGIVTQKWTGSGCGWGLEEGAWLNLLAPPTSVPPLPAPPPEVLPELPEVPAIDLRRLILDHAQAPEGAELGAILGPDWPRPRVARAFALCLELCAARWLKLEQPRPYGPITIRLRPPRQ
ncbi:meiotic recombination protein REC8 homolog [Pyrgilauda ruficollis]|uniref:meiotic recombination protein REC8 homolog n=1 Tax=Pyrgilauda ruficollis TaxID=221976 RepID=UPI001B87B5CA|nr:meiotic recombination protein REC8 homolog [Pyrgilauda ruficollis]